MPEPVDRLELVADEEQLLRIAGAQQVDQLGLEAIRVLELVHHDRTEPELLRLPDHFAVTEEIPGSQLQILEIERRFAILGGGIRGREAGEELLKQLAVAGGQLLEGKRVHRSSRIVERRRPRPTRR